MNILAAGMIADEIGISTLCTRGYLREITGLPHRLEKIGEKQGIIFVEDSKSTSSQSLEAALGSYAPVKSLDNDGSNKNLLLIVGGSDKGDSFEYLSPLLHERAKALVCIGATKDHFVEIAKRENIPYLATDILSDGVSWLYEQGIE
jgi:UDP-N-acetylmuramoylalanine--D-glutamate ligase